MQCRNSCKTGYGFVTVMIWTTFLFGQELKKGQSMLSSSSSDPPFKSDLCHRALIYAIVFKSHGVLQQRNIFILAWFTASARPYFTTLIKPGNKLNDSLPLRSHWQKNGIILSLSLSHHTRRHEEAIIRSNAKNITLIECTLRPNTTTFPKRKH